MPEVPDDGWLWESKGRPITIS